MKLKGIRVGEDVLAELDRSYPGITPHQAIRKVLGMSAKDFKRRRRASRIKRVLTALFK